MVGNGGFLVDENRKKFVTMLVIKNQLINSSIEEIMEINESESQTKIFLSAINQLLKDEAAFILMDSKLLIKIEEFIHEKRFKFSNNEINCLINEVIVRLNSIKTKNEVQINLLKNGYLIYQEDCRKTEFKDNEELLYCMAYDIIVYMNLEKGSLADLEFDGLFLATTNYFLETVPEIYCDPLFFSQTLERIDHGCHTHGFKNFKYREYAKKTKESFQKKLSISL